MSAFIHVVQGTDATLAGDAVLGLIDEAVGDGDRSLMVDSLSGDEYDLNAVADAARTPPFLTEARVVVARGVDRFKADDLGPLLDYLADPLDSTVLILEFVGGKPSKKLAAALKKAGAVTHSPDPPDKARPRHTWVADQVKAAGLRIDSAGQQALASRLGEDLGRLSGVLALLSSSYGDTPIGAAEVEEFAGEAGGAKPWDLTDAIDKGQVPAALRALHRLEHASAMHPLQIMATLQRHYTNMMKVDGGANSKEEAAAILGSSPFVAQKALAQSRKLGSGGIARAMRLLSDTDQAIKGSVGYPREVSDELVMEMLVTRLCRLAG